MPIALLLAVVALDILVGRGAPLTGVLILGPLLASLRLDTRETALVSGTAFVLAVALGFHDDAAFEPEQIIRAIAVVAGGVVCVRIAGLRVDREQGALLLAVQGSVSRILNESETLREAAPRLLRVIGEALGWQLGALWQVDPEGDRIRRVAGWRARGFEAPQFESVSGEAAFECGEGLPGRIWKEGVPLSIPNLRDAPSYPRSAVAAASGLEAAFAFPVRAGDRVVGVIEFLACRFKEVDPGPLEMFSGLGRQIGQFIERRHGEEQRAEIMEREHEARLAAERAERRAGETVALLDTLLARAPAGFAFIDRELRYLRVNDALAAVYGRSVEAVVGRPVEEVIPGLPQVANTLRRVLATGEPSTDLEVTGEAPGAPGVEHHWLASYYPVRGADDEVLGVGAVVLDITERKRAEARSHFLADATAALSASLDYEVTLGNLARLSVPQLADWCVVDMFDPETARIDRLAIAHSDPSKERLLWDLHRRYPPDVERDEGAAAAIRTREPQLCERIDEPTLRAATRDEHHFQTMRDLGFESAMAVPLISSGEPVGAVTLATAESGRAFGRDDLALATELAIRAGTAVENARLYRERSHIARTLQESLLPPRLPDLPGVELAARYRAAGEANDVGGDFYDVFQTGAQTWGVVVGDVLGKGAGAAAMIGLARHTLRAAAMREPDSVAILSTLNEALYRESAQESFCTAVYMTIDVTDDLMDVELTCAGHPLPLVLRHDGGLETVGHPGTLLGAVPHLVLEPERISLEPGDALVTFTDGVLEARSEEGVFGERRLRDLLHGLHQASARDLAEQVARHAIEFQSGIPRDDLAVLVARRREDDLPPPAPLEGAELQPAGNGA